MEAAFQEEAEDERTFPLAVKEALEYWLEQIHHPAEQELVEVLEGGDPSLSAVSQVEAVVELPSRGASRGAVGDDVGQPSASVLSVEHLRTAGEDGLLDSTGFGLLANAPQHFHAAHPWHRV